LLRTTNNNMSIISWEQEKKVRWAVVISLIFHAVGFIGIVWIDQPGFIAMTPANLLLSLVLIVWTHGRLNFPFFIFMLMSFQVGFFTEYLGVNHQLLFGHYRYEEALGIKVYGVPLMIGVNWFMIVYCCGITVQYLLNMIWNLLKRNDAPDRFNVGYWSVIIDGALLAMFFDWLMEPVAIKLGYWTWLTDGGIPVKNYWDWFFVSAFLLWVFRQLDIPRQNQFAVHLLWIQTLFFLSLRFFL